MQHVTALVSTAAKHMKQTDMHRQAHTCMKQATHERAGEEYQVGRKRVFGEGNEEM